MPDPVRVLFLADSHLGFDEPQRPRVQRRRRGPDFWANYERALSPARSGAVDLVVHGGDLLFRSKVKASLVDRALEPLRRVADSGVPVVLVLGNHERSHLPFPLLGIHPGLHLLDRPRTVVLELAGGEVAIGGFPCVRNNVEKSFRSLVNETGLLAREADIRLLCLHQTVEGARVGPQDFVFQRGADVVRGVDLPGRVAAVLSGHIHRHQVLRSDLGGRLLPAPVLYPGSIERTSYAEKAETKGYLRLVVEPGAGGGTLQSFRFCSLPSRPMVRLRIHDNGSRSGILDRVAKELARLDPESVVSVELEGKPQQASMSAAELRALAPSSMTITLRLSRFRAS